MQNFKQFFLIFFLCSIHTTYASVCSRTPQIRDALIREIGETCNQVTENDLLQIKNLSLKRKRIRELRSEEFEESAKLGFKDAEFT